MHMLPSPRLSFLSEQERDGSTHSGFGSGSGSGVASGPGSVAYAQPPPRSDERTASPAAPMIPPRVPQQMPLEERQLAWSESVQALQQRYPADTPAGLSLVSHYLPGKSARPHRLGSRRHRGRSLYMDQNSISTPGTESKPRSRLSSVVSVSGGAFRRSTYATSHHSIPGHPPVTNTPAAVVGNPLFHPPNIPAASALNAHKTAAGRAAWGPDGGGNAALGAGGYEDDDGIDLGARLTGPPVSDPESIVPAPDTTSTGLLPRITAARRRQQAGSSDKSSPREIDEKYNDNDAEVPTQQNGAFLRLFGGLFWRLSGRKYKYQPLRWNKFKWTLVVVNTLLTCYAIGGLIGCILTWTRVWDRSDVVKVSARTELILGTVAATMFFIAAIVGWCGILLNNRIFLTAWNLLLWASLAFLLPPGYIAYKKHTFNLEGKTNELWSRSLDVQERQIVQNTLSCCGYYNPSIEASESSLCYARSALPGCKGRFLRFERKMFYYFYTVAFSITGLHLVLIVVALLCSNHVTYRFGKGLTPAPYQLDAATARTIKDDFLQQLSQLYGSDLVRQVLELQRRNMSHHVVPSSLSRPGLPARDSKTFSYMKTLNPSGSAAHTMAQSIAHAPWKGDEDDKDSLLPPDRNALFVTSSGASSPLTAGSSASVDMSFTSSGNPRSNTNRFVPTLSQH